MIRLGKLTDYGLLLMTAIARDEHQETYTARGLATLTRVPLPTVSKILKLLNGAELLVSHRGVKGGYGLSRAAQDISIAEIIAALEGPIGLTECSTFPGNCGLEPSCPLRTNFGVISAALRQALEKVKLSDLAHPLPVSKMAKVQFLTLDSGRVQ
jgi:FeS assembly SUF system regulator